MRRLALALLCGAALWIGPAHAQSTGGPANNPACNKTALFSGVAVATKLVSNATGKAIFLCGWHITNTAAAGTFQFTSGTQTTNPCDTGSANVTPTFNVTSSAPSADHLQGSQTQIGTTTTPVDLCVTPSVNTISGMIWYSQF